MVSNYKYSCNKEEIYMSIGGKVAWFIGGALFGSAGLRVLSGRDAKKVYTHAVCR